MSQYEGAYSAEYYSTSADEQASTSMFSTLLLQGLTGGFDFGLAGTPGEDLHIVSKSEEAAKTAQAAADAAAATAAAAQSNADAAATAAGMSRKADPLTILGGMAAGAVAGSAFPVIGTALGAMGGGMAGWWYGRKK